MILLDINLPDMNGYQVLRLLRESEATKTIPVVALSADAMPIDMQRGLETGFNHYLTNPVDAEELISTMYKNGVTEQRSGVFLS